ncbi:hypothetical protein [Amycolatopsis thermophila]|uniref:Uncharacterized protein n=1 Tax=Amycolatopsis thermophila TaxID=206084 RepID=A0ABU0EMM7_9PSEU|nr:hypothetical protein [Amycolatopsis thermophila]MDQ0376546.1 hypothetical protein [Amycolatopsis thermophila]
MMDPLGWFIAIMVVLWIAVLVWALFTRDRGNNEPYGPTGPGEWMLASRDPDTGLEVWHRDGVPWLDSPLPAIGHECWPQTRGIEGHEETERCPCGAIRIGGGRWLERNTRTPGQES